MKPIILIIIFSAVGTWIMQELRHPNLSIQSEKANAYTQIMPSTSELVRWQW